MEAPRSYREFWPFYVREHLNPTTRLFHFIGTAGVLLFLAAALATRNAWWLLAMPLCGYGFAWAAHAFVERNEPATFTHPFWSLIGDFHMFVMMAMGRMSAEVERHREGVRLDGLRK
ncbi:MAG: hypothetical protein CMM46_18555 [Rhodospirillaceae bacterium]|nr:hypothetical protein [Rhodospirillaceae bacterium]